MSKKFFLWQLSLVWSSFSRSFLGQKLLHALWTCNHWIFCICVFESGKLWRKQERSQISVIKLANRGSHGSSWDLKYGSVVPDIKLFLGLHPWRKSYPLGFRSRLRSSVRRVWPQLQIVYLSSRTLYTSRFFIFRRIWNIQEKLFIQYSVQWGQISFFYLTKIANSFYSKINDSSRVRTTAFSSSRFGVRVSVVPNIFTIYP